MGCSGSSRFKNDGWIIGRRSKFSINYRVDFFLFLNRSGEYFVSGGEDKEVKVWHYDEGTCKYVGFGHSNIINKVKIKN